MNKQDFMKMYAAMAAGKDVQVQFSVVSESWARYRIADKGGFEYSYSRAPLDKVTWSTDSDFEDGESDVIAWRETPKPVIVTGQCLARTSSEGILVTGPEVAALRGKKIKYTIEEVVDD